MAVAVLGIFMSFVQTVRPIENPYLTISKRNAFDLTGEPPPAPKTAPEPPKSEDIKLTGIYRQEGVERAALALIDTKKKAAEPPKYLQLAAGEKKDGIEIVSIEKATGKVTIKEFGELRSLSFKEDTFKTSVTKAPRKTSSRSSSSKSSSSSAAAKKAAEIRASIEKKRAEEAAKRNLDRCEIRAPFDGMVARAGVRPGQFAALATPLGELFATDVAEVRLPLIASDLSFIDLPRPGAKVALGQAPKVTLSTRAGEQRTEWLGHIVRSEETVDPMNRMVYVVAQVVDPYGLAKRDGAPLRSGTFVRASIEGQTQENVIVLPRHALRGRNQVWIVSENKLTFRTVKVAFADAKQVIVAAGIQPGEQVVVSLLAAVVDGMGVKVREAESTDE